MITRETSKDISIIKVGVVYFRGGEAEVRGGFWGPGRVLGLGGGFTDGSFIGTG